MRIKDFIVVSILSALVSAGSAQAAATSAKTDEPYTEAQLKQMASQAHSPEQFEALEDNYGLQQTYYQRLAADEKAVWERRSQNIVSVNAKYPRPVDSAKYLYEYYAYRAAEAGSLSAKYRQQAEPAQMGLEAHK